MKPKKNLYCLVIIPPENLIKHISTVKVEIARKYNCADLIKAHPFITLQLPFQQLPYREEIIMDKLRRFSNYQSPFHLKLDGFCAYGEQSIGINVKNAANLKNLQWQLSRFLIDELFFSEEMVGAGKFRPTIPIALKGLKSKFRKVYNDYKSKRFEASFQVNNMYLLRHNYQEWEVIKELDFKGVGYTMDLFQNQHLVRA